MTALHLLMAGISSATQPTAFSADYYLALQQELARNASSTSYPVKPAERPVARSSVSDGFATGFSVRSFSTCASMNRTQVPVPKHGALESIQPAIQRISQFAVLKDDWDFEGAPAPSARSVADSLSFLSRLPWGAWEVQLHADGSIMLEREVPGELIELTFVGAGEVDAFVRKSDYQISRRLDLSDLVGWLTSV